MAELDRSKLVVRRAFVKDGVYVTNSNRKAVLEEMSDEEVKDRLKNGYLDPTGDTVSTRMIQHRTIFLAGVDFASDVAAEEAAENRLTQEHFKGRKPSSTRGYTADDVRSITPPDNGGQ